MELFQQLLNKAKQKYGQADRNIFGGLLPGGAASPLSTPKATIQKIASPQGARDFVAVPLLDTAMQAGVVPATPAMFARFLSGTEQPLTKLHPDLLKEIPAAVEKASTPQTVTNPEWNQAYNQVLAEKKAEFKDPVTAKMFAMDYMNKSQIPREIQNTLVIDKQGRIPVQYGHYGDFSALTETLGQFYADKKTGEITDRYDFNYYMPDNLDPDLTNIKSGFDLLRGGNPRGLIPFSNALGLIKPGSGYPIQVKP